MRVLLVGLIVLATVGFVVGTSIERHNTGHEPSSPVRSEGDESAAAHAAESPAGTKTEPGTELRPLGVDIEAVPFVALAALASLALAALAWSRPRWLLGLTVIAAAMLVFGALDVREAVHQAGEDRTGLAILAATIAVLHLAAAGTAGGMARRAEQGPAGTAGTVAA